MATSREKILERRKRLEQEQLREEAKLKALKEKLKATEAEILETEKKEETERQVIIARIFSERMKTDEGLKSWFNEALLSQVSPRERNLFDLAARENL